MKTKSFLLVLTIMAFSCNLCSANLFSEVSFSVSDVSFTAKDEFTQVSLPKSFHTTEPGAPQIPVTSVSFIIPQNVRIIRVKVLSTEKELISGDFYLYPAQKEMPIGMTAPFTEPNKEIYESKNPYPGKIIQLAGDGFMGGYHILGLFVYPLEYIPNEQKLYLYSKIKFELQYEDAHRQYVTPPSGIDEGVEKILRDKVSNPDEIHLYKPQKVLGKVVSPPADSIPYVIITNQEMKPAFQSLANWKTKRGTKTEIKTVSSIEAEYSGVDLAEKIRSFIQYTYQNRYTQWVLLGGDVNIILARYANVHGFSTDIVLTDQYYSCLDGNWNLDGDTLYAELEDSIDLFPEVYVGRVPATNYSQACFFVDKLFSYEKDSPYYDYQTKALFLSSHLWEGINNQQFSDSLSRVLPDWFSKTSLYEYSSETGIAYMDSGFGLITNYSHAQNSGNFLAHHDGGLDPIYKSDIDTLKNTDRFSVMLNVTCWNNNLAEDCLSKHFILNLWGGGVGYIGSSFWDFPYTTRGMHVAFFDKLFNEGEPHIGRTLALAKLSFGWFSMGWAVAAGINTWRYTYLSYLLLGDPQMEIWTESPSDLTLIYPTSLDPGPNSFSVTVQAQDFNGFWYRVWDALVCLQKDGEVYELKRTNDAGWVHFDVDFPTAGVATVVASKTGYVPAEGSITIGSPGGCPFVSVWNGVGFEQDNVILTASEDNDRAELSVVDYCPLRHAIEPQGDQYLLEISEFENEISHLDYFGLIVADYPPNQRIGVTPEGKVFSFRDPVSPISCVDQNGGDHLSEVLHEDGNSFSSFTKGSLIINFGQLNTDGLGKITNTLAEGGGPWIPPPPKYQPKITPWRPEQREPNILYVDVLSKVGVWENVNKIYPRTNPMTTLVDLSQYTVPSRDFVIRLRWERFFIVDYIAYYTFDASNIELNTLTLSSAEHSVEGDITSTISQADNNTVSLSPSKQIQLSFPALREDISKKRLFILAARGYYETVGGPPSEEPGTAPGENMVLLQNYPNPFNPQTEIRYVLPTDCHVKLTIYNILGQKVRILVDKFETTGHKRINWDGQDEWGNEVANGIYFYRLQAGEYDQVRKMLLLK